jgi:hypothetical protein
VWEVEKASNDPQVGSEAKEDEVKETKSYNKQDSKRTANDAKV